MLTSEIRIGAPLIPKALTLSILLSVTLFAQPHGTWVAVPADKIPMASGELINHITSDPKDVVYFVGQKTIQSFDGATFTPLSPMVPTSAAGRFYLSPGRYWIGDRTDFWFQTLQDTPFLTFSDLQHIRNGVRLWDQTCIVGNDIRLLGTDAKGRLLIDERMNAGMGTWNPALIRFSEGKCDTMDIDIDPHSEFGAVAYARDSLDREYFGTEMISDVASCGPTVRLDHGRLDTLINRACVTYMIATGNQVLVSSRDSVWITDETGAHALKTVKGRKLPQLEAAFRDSHGVLWLGLGSQGILTIDGKDSTFMDSAHSDFKSSHPSSFAEDAEGNVWIKAAGGLWIFARGRVTVPVARARASRMSPSLTPKNHDALGRKAAHPRSLRYFGAIPSRGI